MSVPASRHQGGLTALSYRLLSKERLTPPSTAGWKWTTHRQRKSCLTSRLNNPPLPLATAAIRISTQRRPVYHSTSAAAYTICEVVLFPLCRTENGVLENIRSGNVYAEPSDKKLSTSPSLSAMSKSSRVHEDRLRLVRDAERRLDELLLEKRQVSLHPQQRSIPCRTTWLCNPVGVVFSSQCRLPLRPPSCKTCHVVFVQLHCSCSG